MKCRPHIFSAVLPHTFGRGVRRRRRLIRLWLSTLLVAGCAATFRNAMAAQGRIISQSAGQDDLDYYSKARPIVDRSPDELTRAIPELKGFEPAESQAALPLILRKVGENVAAFFHNFVNTTSVEEIHQVWMRRFGPLQKANYMKLNYLLLALPDRNGVALQEYRTDNKGKSAAFTDEPGEFMLTSGFASVSVYFHPKYQPLATFRYLGRKKLNGRETLLVVFAQRRERGAVLARFKFGQASIPVLVQGVAWIDSTRYEILRMRTDLLAPLSHVSLEQATTDILFEEMRFRGLPDPMWLPREVNVTVRLADKTYHNQHRYSDYKLFNVEAGEKPLPNSAAPRPE